MVTHTNIRIVLESEIKKDTAEGSMMKTCWSDQDIRVEKQYQAHKIVDSSNV